MKTGFSKEVVSVPQGKVLKIGLIDADLLNNGTRHPNLALLKISGYCKRLGHDVRLICDYDELRDTVLYDILAMSKVFKFTVVPEDICKMIDDDRIYVGGTGFFEVNGPVLDDEIEHSMPDYHLYDEYIERETGGDPDKKKKWSDYLNFSIGFTTRGCIRQCGFCVNRLSRRVERWSPVSEFLDPSRPKIYLWDDNIMAAPPKVFEDVMRELKETGKYFQFRQGMDIRLMTKEKARMLADMNYYGDYIFAFDHYRLDDPKEKKEVDATVKGLKVWRENCDQHTKLYVLVAYDSLGVEDIVGAFYRIRIIMEYGCWPYIMRFEKYKDSEFKDMYTQLARWCNQPSFFKKTSFREFCVRNEEIHQGLNLIYDKRTYRRELFFPEGFKKKERGICYRTMKNFEERFPEIAKEYFDMRYEDIKQYKVR